MVIVIKDFLKPAENTLSKCSSSARIDAELLLTEILNVERSYLYTHSDATLSPQQVTQYQQMIERRVAGEPIAYILGHCEFWSLKFNVDQHTLIPRPETELLVELTLEKLDKDKPLHILELGTGSGAIAIALAKERPNWQITATDIEFAALQVAQDNAKRHQIENIQFCQSDWYCNVTGQLFAAIVSNPPYISIGDSDVEASVKDYEPGYALYAGHDGLSALSNIIAEAPSYLERGGLLLLEHGWQQAEQVQNLLEKVVFNQCDTTKDYSGHPRFTYAYRI